jgi:hypothetical protein
MQSAIQQAATELYDLAARTLKTLRWRMNHPAGHNPILGTRGLHFSIGGASWKPLVELGFEIEVRGSLHLADEIRNEIETMVAEGSDEPLGHELHREALAQRRHNPRSSLIIAISAAEVGFKECVGDLIPGARWLIDHVPSPPLVQMLSEYLPLLPAKCKINDKVLPPPKEILECLTKAVNMRNTATHTGKQTIEPDTLKEILLAVKDVLCLLDYYRGSAWALDYIRPETRSALHS